MAHYDNPFADPFEDSAVMEATSKKDQVTDESYNPFSNEGHGLTNVLSSSSTRDYNGTTGVTAADLQKRQEELDRRAEILRQREEAMQRNLSASESINNFPPLPGFCPIKPCFHQDIESEIPVQFQKLVALIYYFWLAYTVLLFWNASMCLAYFVVTVECSLRNHSAVNFTLSLLNLIIFIPASYVFWFRPVYKAFKYDSSINFFIFFFIFFMQFITSVLQCLAIDGWGFVGILNSMDLFTAGHTSASVVGVFMFLTGIVFGVSAALVMVILLKVHQVYRSSGGSLAKAQMELTSDVKSSRVMQEAAGNIVESAASQALLSRN